MASPIILYLSFKTKGVTFAQLNQAFNYSDLSSVIEEGSIRFLLLKII
jgi:hypothetical protein